LDADADQQEEEELAPAGIFRTRAEAKAARERLQAAFVPTFLENDDGRFRLLVPGSYLALAREVLKL